MIINIISEWRRGKNISQKISTNNSQFSFMIKKTFKVQHHIYLTHLGYILKHKITISSRVHFSFHGRV